MVVLGAQVSKKVILVDLDDTLIELVENWTNYLSNKYNLNVCKKDITDWEITQFFPTLTTEQVIEPLSLKSFWEEVKPISESPHYLMKLYEEGYDIYIVTATNYRVLPIKIEKIINVYFPFIDNKHIILADNKHMILGDVLIDDKLDNLLGNQYNKILFRQPHNKFIDVEKYNIYDANNWHECYEKIHNILD